jgi:hypothetical protein
VLISQVRLSHRRDGSRGNGGKSSVNAVNTNITVDGLLGAVPRDMACLSALVAGLTGGVERATIRGSAVPRDVSQLATCVALHRLCLTVSRVVVWQAALEAGRGSGSSSESTSALEASKVPTRSTSGCAGHSAGGARRVGTGTSQMSLLTAVVATTASSCAAQT